MTSWTFKDLGDFFVGHKTQRQQILLSFIHGLKIMIVESFPLLITCWGAVVFEKWVKKKTRKYFSYQWDEVHVSMYKVSNTSSGIRYNFF